MRSLILMTTMTMVGLLSFAPAASAAHTIDITSGAPAGETYTMNVDVENFQLVSFQGKEAQKGEGHIHYLANGQDACAAGKADCSAPTDYATPSQSFTYTNLEDGDVLQAELVLSDHSASGTDSNGNLNGARVLSEEVEVGSNAPGPGFVAALAALAVAGVALGRRR